MKTLKLLLCFSLFTFHFSLSYGQTWKWGQGGYGSNKSNDYGSPVATDNSGNSYITGQFATTLIFGTVILTGGSENVYLAKFNSAGKVAWAKAVVDSANGYSFSSSVATDKSGNVFIAGEFSGSVTFGNVTLRSNTSGYGYYDAFLVKYDANGNVLWAQQSTHTYYSTSNATAYSVATDNDGNAIVSGYFEYSVSFGSHTLTSSGLSDYFLVKYSSLGNVLWAEQSNNNAGSINYESSVAVDYSDNSYMSGTFSGSISFGNYTLSSPYNSIFLVKYSFSGNVLWARQSEGSIYYSNNATEETAVITDHEGNAYISGNFEDSLKLGAYSLFSPGGYCIFLTKYDADGTVLWAKQSSPGWVSGSLSSDEGNHIYLSGENEGGYSNSLMVGNYTLTNTNYSQYASFVLSFDEAGIPLCGSMLGNLGYGGGQKCGMASDVTGTYVFIAGTFDNGTIICGKDTVYSYGGGANVFVGRWQPCYAPSYESSSTQVEQCNDVFIPDAFTPNNKVYNTILYVRSSCISSMDFQVFDRWGKKVFESGSMNDGWDGTYKGSPMNTGTYIWCLNTTMIDGTTLVKSGNVALIR